MKIKDKTMKEFLENNSYFVDFFNAYFFDGEKVLKPENCEELDSEMNDSHMDLEKHVDVIRKYNDGNLYSAFIIENQSYVCLLYTSPSPRDRQKSRMPSSA